MAENRTDGFGIQKFVSQIVASNLVGPFLELQKQGKSLEECYREIFETYGAIWVEVDKRIEEILRQKRSQ